MTRGQTRPEAIWRRALVLIVCWSLGALGTSAWFTPADARSAEALWQWAASEAEGDWAHPAWVDAAEACHRLRPWQAGYPTARARVHLVDRARRRAAAAER